MDWRAIALQEAGRGDATAEDAVVRSRDGHMYFTAKKHPVDTRATTIAVHWRRASAVYEVQHAPRISKVTVRVQHGGQQNEVNLALISVHMPRAIGHWMDEMDIVATGVGRLLPGTKTMVVMGADLNPELMDPLGNDGDAVSSTRTSEPR